MGQDKIDRQFDELALLEGLQREDLVYIYRGVFSQVITDSIIALTENNLDSVGESSKLKKRVLKVSFSFLNE